MVGGHATHSGIGFQDKAASVIAVHVLANEPLPLLGLLGGVTVSGLELETSAPIDDILAKNISAVDVARSSDGVGQRGDETYPAESSDPKRLIASLLETSNQIPRHNIDGPMVEKRKKRSSVMINRAPVLTLWAAEVAEMLGFEYDEALTLGRAVAGLNAYSKGVALGLFQPTPKAIAPFEFLSSLSLSSTKKTIRSQAGCEHHPIDIMMRYPAAGFPVCFLKPELLDDLR